MSAHVLLDLLNESGTGGKDKMRGGVPPTSLINSIIH